MDVATSMSSRVLDDEAVLGQALVADNRDSPVSQSEELDQEIPIDSQNREQNLEVQKLNSNIENNQVRSLPWIVTGDFNVVSSIEEYLGSSHPDMNIIENFNKFLEDCNLFNLPFTGNKFA
ncbi:hypothetical protein ACH5RR_008692 [Cinchona calisaya]|uniref:Uncharacterized protein n=1 Tax=Cinchona calisaya TaxID=153742 RepID=A0ABD3AC27_9GENT